MTVQYVETKRWEGVVSRCTNWSISRDKTRRKLGIIAYRSIAGYLETGRNRCYCKPYVHIAKLLAGANTCTYISWVSCTLVYRSGNTYRRPKPNIICLGSRALPAMKRSGRKDSGSPYISEFLLISLRNISKELSKVRIGGRRKVLQTINLPWRQHLWEYDIQDTDHPWSMYGESL